MYDRDFLMWIHERLEHVYGERPTMDYMHKLRAVIKGTPSKKETPATLCCNNLEDLKKFFLR